MLALRSTLLTRGGIGVLAFVLVAPSAHAQSRVDTATHAIARPSHAPRRTAPREEPPATLTVTGSLPYTAASSQTVRDRDLQLRIRTRPADLFEVAPGLLVVQHAGGGKANQYFLRGFDADHGTDIAFSIDDIPINLVSHAHGQGYADPHFVIPELIQRVEVREGPYFASDGDFATAGAIDLRLRERIDHSFLSVENTFVANPIIGARMFSNYRALGVASLARAGIDGYVATEYAHLDGPFVSALNFDHVNVVGRFRIPVTARSEFELTLLSYTGRWNASGQIPERLVGQPYMGRTFTQYDSVDPSDGGHSGRHQLALTFRARPNASNDVRVMVYAARYDLTLWSNFSFDLDDPIRGDQLEQNDARTMAGGRATWRNTVSLSTWRFLTLLGTSIRYDDIENGLHHTTRRTRWSDVREDRVRQTDAGFFLEEQVVPRPWVRLIVGLRYDVLAFSLRDLLPGASPSDVARNGDLTATVFSPKASVVFSPIHSPAFDLDLYLNFGRGFHSNDARGVTLPRTADITAQCADPMHVAAGVQCPVTPITQATGMEFGVRARILRRIDVSVAAWALGLDHETVWNGDAGTTEPSLPTRRLGVTGEARVQITPWLWADLDASFVDARFVDAPMGADLVPLAPPWMIAGGLSVRHPIGLFGAVRVRAIGDRPADPENRYRARGFAVAYAQVGFRHAWYELALSAENLLGSDWREAQFVQNSRAPMEPIVCPAGNVDCHAGIHFTPGDPFSATLRLTAYW